MSERSMTIFDSETKLTYDVDFRITAVGSPAHMGSLTYPGDPGEPIEIEVDRVTILQSRGVPVDLTHPSNTEILERLESKIIEHLMMEPDPYDDYYDPDEWR